MRASSIGQWSVKPISGHFGGQGRISVFSKSLLDESGAFAATGSVGARRTTADGSPNQSKWAEATGGSTSPRPSPQGGEGEEAGGFRCGERDAGVVRERALRSQSAAEETLLT